MVDIDLIAKIVKYIIIALIIALICMAISVAFICNPRPVYSSC